MASWLSLRSIPCSRFPKPIPSVWLPTVNRSPLPGIIPQSPWLQLPASVDTSGLTTLSEVWKAASWLVYVVLTLFRVSQISEFTPQLLQMLPPSQWMAMDAGISPLSFSSLIPGCRLVALVSSFFPLPPVPSSLSPTKFYTDPDIPSQYSGSPSRAHLVFCENCCISRRSWCIRGERWAPLPPTALSSCPPPFVHVLETSFPFC